MPRNWQRRNALFFGSLREEMNGEMLLLEIKIKQVLKSYVLRPLSVLVVCLKASWQYVVRPSKVTVYLSLPLSSVPPSSVL